MDNGRERKKDARAALAYSTVAEPGTLGASPIVREGEDNSEHFRPFLADGNAAQWLRSETDFSGCFQ